MDKQSKFYVTTPIYYVTAKPHLGTLYSTLLADIAARYARMQEKRTFLLTGTDEHGQKVAQAANKAGKDPQSFVDGFIDKYKQTWHAYSIDYSHFIRTTDDHHKKAVQKWLQQLIDQGAIYKSHYEGQYCTHCETFVTAKEGDLTLCPSCGRETSAVSEESYFFRLSAYQEKLLAFLESNPNFIIPKQRTKEVVNFIKSGLKDLCISRSTISWGIPFPGDEQHVTYVWADALNNYITAIGYGDDARQKEFALWWPADLQVLGKDILRFHAVYWPAFLMASGLALPKRLLVHGWITVDEQKMSKSLGNVVDPEALQKEYGTDPVRYYLASQMAVTQDANFSINGLRACISADLANNIGNLLSRTVALATKGGVTELQSSKTEQAASLQILKQARELVEEVTVQIERCAYHIATSAITKFVGTVNAYFHEQQPWVLAKEDQKLFEQILWTTCAALQTVGHLLWPIMPAKMHELLLRLGVVFTGDPRLQNATAWGTFVLQGGEGLFMKYEPIAEDRQANMKEEKESHITFDEFAQVDLRVGTIETCEEVEKSDKLLKLQVDFGELGKRQILAGVKKFFSADQLVGKQGVFVVNLKPRKMMGMESQGMMLMAEDDNGNLRRITVDEVVPSGTRLR